MKLFFYRFTIAIVLLMVGISASYAQNCCPYIDQIQILPPNPADTSNIKIAVQVTASSMGNFISSNVSIPAQGSVEISLCYFAGMLPTLQTYNDTLSLGVLSAGVYSLQIRAYQTPVQNDCNAGSVNDSIISFSVSTVTSAPTLKINKDHGIKVFATDLNPYLFLNNLIGKIRIINISGQIIFEGKAPIPDSNVSGFHTVEIENNTGAPTRIYWVKP
jgi:hypothetical protein